MQCSDFIFKENFNRKTYNGKLLAKCSWTFYLTEGEVWEKTMLLL